MIVCLTGPINSRRQNAALVVLPWQCAVLVLQTTVWAECEQDVVRDPGQLQPLWMCHHYYPGFRSAIVGQ